MPGNIHDVPLSILKTWPAPNYDDPVTRSWLPGFAMFWQIVSTLLVWARIWLHGRRQAGSTGLDDAFLLAAWAVSVALTACAWIDSEWYGIDRHTWDVRLSQYTGAALIAWIAQVLMLLSTGATKASVLLFYRRMVLDTLGRRWRIAIYSALVFHFCYVVGTLLALLLVCRPLQAYWMSYDFNWHRSYQCSPANALNPVVGVLSVVSDLYAVALPFLILRHYDLGVSRRQRIGLDLLFAAGTLVAGAGIARTYFLISLGETYDTSWVGFDLYVWSIIECQLALICASAPSLRAVFRRYLTGPVARTCGSSESRSPSGTRLSMTLRNTWHRASFIGVKQNDDTIQLHVVTKPSIEALPKIAGNQAEGAQKGRPSHWHETRRSSRLWHNARDIVEIDASWLKEPPSSI